MVTFDNGIDISDNPMDILKSNLIKNAFDFLEKAIKQFEEEPKFSIINFCTAIELFLKVRLMHEHWSLIVLPSHPTKPPSLMKFKSGDFKSIGFKDIIPKIEAITNTKVPKDIKKCFEGLATHRNKIVHFYHPNMLNQDEQEAILIEELNSWAHLQKLFTRWSFIFEKYHETIFSINATMHQNKKFLETKFETLKPEIENDKINNQATYVACGRCNKEAGKEGKLTEKLYEYKCKVCSCYEHLIKVKCPSAACNATIEINEENIESGIQCSNCNTPIALNPIFEELDTASYDRKTQPPEKNCGACLDGYNSVIKHHNYYICRNCLFATEHADQCDWCGEMQIGGISENSGAFGCDFCEGGMDYYTSKND